MNITDEMLYQAAQEAEELWLDAVLPEKNAADIMPSLKLQHRVMRLCRNASARATAEQVLSVFRKTAVILLITLAAAFSGLMTVEAFRCEVLNLITEVYEQYMILHINPLDRTNKGYFYQSLPEVRLHYLPEGATYQSKHGDSTSVTITYQGHGAEASFVTLQVRLFRPTSDYSIVFSTDHAEVQHFYMDNVDITAYTTGEITTLRWFQENLYFELYGNLPPEQMLLVAKRIEIDY